MLFIGFNNCSLNTYCNLNRNLQIFVKEDLGAYTLGMLYGKVERKNNRIAV